MKKSLFFGFLPLKEVKNVKPLQDSAFTLNSSGLGDTGD